MKKIKILYTIPNFNTAGSGKVVYDLVKGLDKEKFEPAILVKHTRGAFFKEVEKLGVPIHVFNYETEYYPLWSFPFRIWKVVRFFKSLKVDIVHSWHWSSDFSEPLAVRLAGIKFVYTKKNMGWGNKAWVWKSKLSTQVIAINKDMMEQFFNPISSISAKYIPLGVDTDYYRPSPFDHHLAEKIGIKKEDFVVITVANLVPLKGIEKLIEAFLKAELSNAKLLIVGNNENEYGQSLVNQYTSDTIIFTGKKMDVRPYLSLASIFCITTEDIGEGLPIAPLEAMSMGIPVIGSKVSGITDVLEGFEEWIFEAKNDLALTNKLQNINKVTKNKRFELGTKMRWSVIQRFPLYKCLESNQKMYEEF